MSGTFEGLGTLQFTPDNKFAYAYSGMIVGSTSVKTTYLEFTTNSEYVNAIIQNGSTNETTRKTLYIYFNDILLVRNDIDNAYAFPNTYSVTIPPFTTVKIQIQLSGDDGMSSWVTLNGKVKGAIEQQNLEAITDNNNWASK